MRKGVVHCGGRIAGRLVEEKDGYHFCYEKEYLQDPLTDPVSLTLPKQSPPHFSKTLFPFFFGLLAEGALKDVQCHQLKLDEDDAFGRLLLTAGSDTIGAVTVHPEDG